MKTNHEVAEECTKLALGIIGLMQPNSKLEFDRALNIAIRLVDLTITSHIEKSFEAAAAKAGEAMEGK